MRHRKKIRRLGRGKGERIALVRNLARSLIEHREITTTEAKAKEVRRMAERVITLGKRGDLASHRRIACILADPGMVKPVRDLAVKYRERKGGCVQLIHLVPRRGDNARMMLVRFL